jgi:hypothetical protein
MMEYYIMSCHSTKNFKNPASFGRPSFKIVTQHVQKLYKTYNNSKRQKVPKSGVYAISNRGAPENKQIYDWRERKLSYRRAFKGIGGGTVCDIPTNPEPRQHFCVRRRCNAAQHNDDEFGAARGRALRRARH